MYTACEFGVASYCCVQLYQGRDVDECCPFSVGRGNFRDSARVLRKWSAEPMTEPHALAPFPDAPDPSFDPNRKTTTSAWGDIEYKALLLWEYTASKQWNGDCTGEMGYLLDDEKPHSQRGFYYLQQRRGRSGWVVVSLCLWCSEQSIFWRYPGARWH